MVLSAVFYIAEAHCNPWKCTDFIDTMFLCPLLVLEGAKWICSIPNQKGPIRGIAVKLKSQVANWRSERKCIELFYLQVEIGQKQTGLGLLGSFMSFISKCQKVFPVGSFTPQLSQACISVKLSLRLLDSTIYFLVITAKMSVLVEIYFPALVKLDQN